jgi:hypothetical protein
MTIFLFLLLKRGSVQAERKGKGKGFGKKGKMNEVGYENDCDCLSTGPLCTIRSWGCSQPFLTLSKYVTYVFPGLSLVRALEPYFEETHGPNISGTPLAWPVCSPLCTAVDLLQNGGITSGIDMFLDVFWTLHDGAKVFGAKVYG